MKILESGEYFGEKRKEINIPGVLLSDYDYHNPNTIWHHHEHPYLMYVLKGDLTDISKKGKSLIPAGSLIFHNWQESHMNEKKSVAAGGFHLELNRKWFEYKKLDIDLWEGSKVIEQPDLHHLLAKIYFEYKTNDSFSEVAIEMLNLQLFEGLDERKRKYFQKEPSWIMPLKELLHCCSEQLSLQFLSEQLGVHPVHLSRSIPKYFDCNLGEYLRRQKVKKAFSQLLNPKTSLTEIAYANGFADQSHFTKTFKAYFGHTPSAYRRKLI